MKALLVGTVVVPLLTLLVLAIQSEARARHEAGIQQARVVRTALILLLGSGENTRQRLLEAFYGSWCWICTKHLEACLQELLARGLIESYPCSLYPDRPHYRVREAPEEDDPAFVHPDLVCHMKPHHLHEALHASVFE